MPRLRWACVVLSLCACTGHRSESRGAVTAASKHAIQPAAEELKLPEATSIARRYTRPTTDPVNEIDTGGAIVRVEAPLDVVFQTATDYSRYHTVLPGVDKSVVLGRDKEDTDVYLTLPLLDGTVTAWAVVRFSPFAVPNGRAFRGRMVRGNIEDLRITCRMIAEGPSSTVVSLELLGDTQLPVPVEALSDELAEFAEISLNVLVDQTRAKLRTRGEHRPIERFFDAR